MSTATKLVRINGVPYRVPDTELTDPNGNQPTGGCDAEEPAEYGGAMCTLHTHGPEIMHIAHDGQYNVIAMWGEPAQMTEDEYDSPGRGA